MNLIQKRMTRVHYMGSSFFRRKYMGFYGKYIMEVF